jgi:hypothetical protein
MFSRLPIIGRRYLCAYPRANPWVSRGLIRGTDTARAVGRLIGGVVAKGTGHARGRQRAVLTNLEDDARSWIFRFMQDGPERYMGLGPLDAISLADARQNAEARSQRVNGWLNPIQTLKAARQAAKAAGMPFKTCAETYVASDRATWTDERHAAQWSERSKRMYIR